MPIATGIAAGSLALSLPASHAHRLGAATETLRRKAVPVLLALLLTGAIPPDAPAVAAEEAAPVGRPRPMPAPVTPETLRHLRRLFPTPITGGSAAAGGPHLVSDTAAAAAYLFDAVPDTDQARLSLPLTFTSLPRGA